MKKLAVITITLFTLSGGAFANAADQKPATAADSEKAPLISFSMVKEAFQFGFKSGWMVKK